MATIKFVLNKLQHQVKSKSRESGIFLRYTHQKKYILISAQKNIDEKYWDNKNQIVKRSYPGSDRLNIYLKMLRQRLEDIVNGLMIEGENPTRELVKHLYNKGAEEREKKRTYTFFEYADHYIKNDKKISAGTKKSYNTVLNKLREYEKYAHVKLDWSSFDIDFYYDFFEFYTGIQELTNNGFGKVIKNIKAILNDATTNGYNSCLSYQHKGFKTVRESVSNIYLNEDELQKIMDVDLSSQPNLENIRDLFIFGCYTGLRYSDFSKVKPENIIGETIRIKTQKTGESVVIPLMEPVKIIMEKYHRSPNSLPKSCSNQTMNKYIKKIGKLAGINNMELKIRNKGKERVEERFPKYELISTHTARRSYATNMFKRGIPERMIMKITGHRTEAAFSSYIKVSEDENAELMLKYLEQSI